jgi:hypothetical protein
MFSSIARFAIPSLLLASPSLAQNQEMGSYNICGTQVRGSGNIVNCNVFLGQWPQGRTDKISELCRQEEYGLLPPVLFMTKTNYALGEIVRFQYSGACPQNTRFILLDANKDLDVVLRRSLTGSVLASQFRGSAEMREDKPEQVGSYTIAAVFIDEQRRRFIAGRSLPFNVYSRY